MNTHCVAAPKTLICPHCGAQMNLSGPGRAAGALVYLCARCVPLLQLKELWLGQVVRTGHRDFGFVQLAGAPGLGTLHFSFPDWLDARTGRPSPLAPQVGDPCLVLLGPSGHAHRLWRLPRKKHHPAQPDAPNGHAPFRMPHAPSRTHAPACPLDPRRRHGVISVLKAPDWGFLTEPQTGRAWFIHQRDVIGPGRLQVGRQVTFLPGTTPKGRKACEVRFLN